MGYDLSPRNKAIDGFHFGAFSWPVLLEAAGYMYPVANEKGRWYMVTDTDPRFEGSTYPGPLDMGGFRVTADEARWLARVARNYVAIQRSLPEENRMRSDLSMDDWQQPWPRKIRTDFVDRFAEFADWAEQSRGFAIH